MLRKYLYKTFQIKIPNHIPKYNFSKKKNKKWSIRGDITPLRPYPPIPPHTELSDLDFCHLQNYLFRLGCKVCFWVCLSILLKINICIYTFTRVT